MLPDSPQVYRWQRTLDRTFPHGAMCSWIAPGEVTAYPVPRIEAVSMTRLDPVIRMPVNDGVKVLGPWRVTSYTLRSDGNYRVTFEDVKEPMLWSPNVPAGLLSGMSQLRAQLVSNAPRGGRAVLEDPANG